MRSLAARLVLALAAASLSVALGCDVATTDAADGARRDGGADTAVPATGESAAQLYARLCASCHGETGGGGIGPRLVDSPLTEDDLTSLIDARMPQGAPDRCDASCSRTLARYLLATFTTSALACEAVGPSPRRLRLLTRREFRASVRDLLRLPSEPPVSSPCNERTFELDPAGRTLASVSLAGSFNGWSASAWPMTFDGARGRWTITREIANGDHAYKFVLDGTEWIADPTNPDGADDGFGGRNSLLHVSCTGAPSPTLDPAASLPVESRGEGFLFDDDASSAIVTASHVDEYLGAAERSVSAADVPALLPCSLATDRATCTETFVRGFGRRVFRRPLSDGEASRYGALAASRPDALEGIEVAIRAMLVSPIFLYRSELGELSGDGTYRLTPFEVATALAYQLWGTTPDDALLDAASAGALDDASGIEAAARRLLADDRARGRISDFGLMWLGIEGVTELTKNAAAFPGWSSDLAVAMREESRLFFASVVFDGSHGLPELFTADYGFANELLARHYGLSAVGTGFARVTHPPGTRAGVLGQASVLSSTAHSDQSSPIRRGLFVRRNLLCQTFPLPPPDAGGVPDVDPSATTRERFAMHTSRGTCAGCHQYIDDVGFGFEGFDGIGAVRTLEGGRPVDHHGDMNDVDGLGTNTHAPYDSLPELGAILAGSSAAEDCFVRQYYRFARGARETVEDRCAVEHLTERFRAHGDIRELMIDVVLSPDFVSRREGAL